MVQQGSVSAKNVVARAGQLHAAFDVDDAQLSSQGDVVLGLEIEPSRRTDRNSQAQTQRPAPCGRMDTGPLPPRRRSCRTRRTSAETPDRKPPAITWTKPWLGSSPLRVRRRYDSTGTPFPGRTRQAARTQNTLAPPRTVAPPGIKPEAQLRWGTLALSC